MNSSGFVGALGTGVWFGGAVRSAGGVHADASDVRAAKRLLRERVRQKNDGEMNQTNVGICK